MLERTRTDGLLVAKTQLPKLPARLVPRERLFARMKQGRFCTLTVIKAAAGFGKTSLAMAWANRLVGEGQHVAWVSLDPEDNAPDQFLRYIARALYSACPELNRQGLDLITEVALIRPLDMVHLLLNALNGITEDLFLFLDDYHTLHDRVITACMASLLRHAPPFLHVILTTRTEPDLPLVRLRALNQLTEIDARALRFDIEETSRFLEQEGVEGAEDASALQEKTEGWPVMIRVITATSQQSGHEFSNYVRCLSVRDRPIHSHLADMLNGLPGDVVAFLLQTSVLESLCEPLCRTVTRLDQADRIFEQLTSQQLLLMPLDTEGAWFRCHPLLQGFLLHRLQRESPELICELHRRAYGWYADAQRWTDAIRHAIEAKDTEQAVKWVETCAIALLRRGELLTLCAWERLFPPELMKRQTKARLAIAWGMALAVRFDEALRLAARIEADSHAADQALRDSISCECQTVRAVALSLADEVEAALPLATASMALGASGPWTTNAAANVALLGWWKLGDLDQCYQLPWLSFPGDDGARNVVATVYRFCLLGLIEYTQLHQATALYHFKEALRVARDYAGPYSAAASQPSVFIAQCLYDQGRLDEAKELIFTRLPTINATCMLECVLAASTILIRIASLRGCREEVETLLNRAEELARSHRWGRLEARILRERVRVALLDGQEAAASAYVTRLSHLRAGAKQKSLLIQHEMSNEHDLAEALLLITRQKGHQAMLHLQAVKARAKTRRNQALALEVDSLQALIWEDDKKSLPDPDGLPTGLAQALACGKVQLFIDALPFFRVETRERFRQTVLATPQPGATELADLIKARFLLQQEPYQMVGSGGTPLSPREQTILQCLLEGKSNKTIARDLNVTPETIKTHLKRLFQKLNVSNRSQVVSKYYQNEMGPNKGY